MIRAMIMVLLVSASCTDKDSSSSVLKDQQSQKRFKLVEGRNFLNDAEFEKALNKMINGQLDINVHERILQTFFENVILDKSGSWDGGVTDNDPSTEVGDLLGFTKRINRKKEINVVVAFTDNSNAKNMKPQYNGTYLNSQNSGSMRIFDLYFPSFSVTLSIQNPKSKKDDELLKEFNLEWLKKINLFK